MATTNENLYVYNSKDAEESPRLDWQHGTLKRAAGGNLIPPFIDTSNLEYIADVATGTGAWLLDLSHTLSPTTTSGATRHYRGFDINSSAFTASGPHIDHHIQDITQPFPSENHAKFQLVHIRYTLAFMKTSMLPNVMANLSSLLAPGGYLIWTDMDGFTPTFRIRGSARHEEITSKVSTKFFEVNGNVPNLADAIKKAATAREELEFVSQTTYRPLEILDLKTMQEWERLSFVVGFWPGVLRVLEGLSEEEAKEKTARLAEELRGLHEKGEVWDFEFATLVVRNRGV